MTRSDIIDATNTFWCCLTDILKPRVSPPLDMSAEATASAQAIALRLVAEIDGLEALLCRLVARAERIVTYVDP